QDHIAMLKVAQSAAEKTSRGIVSVQMERPDDVPIAFATLANNGAGAILFPGDAFFLTQRERIAEYALRAHLPTIFAQREYVEWGGLMSYGDRIWYFNRGAAFSGKKIPRGAKPADLPVQQPTRFFLTINRKTAEALGLSIPLELL